MKYLLILILISACASKPAKDPQGKKTVSMESKQLANEEETTLVTEFAYPKKGVALTKTAKKEIRDLYQEASKKGKIDVVKVITWADLEYPSVHTKDLSNDQKKLAENRNKSVEKYLSQLDNEVEVETISMAERPTMLKEMFSANDAEVKKSLEKSGLPNTDTTVKVPGKASKSVVMILMEKK